MAHVPRQIPVLHDEAGVLVVAKPPGMLVVPAPGRSGETLIDVVGRQLDRRVMAVHRLDEDTTGVMVVVSSDEARLAMEAMFRDHTIQRDYLALLSAAPSPPAGRIEAPLEEGADGVVRVAQRGGKRAVTFYETIGRRERCTLVKCRLETGRRNQIRAHLAALGCPLAGDRKYGFRSRPGESFRRVMLHSARIRFVHPLTHDEVDVTVEVLEPELRP